jgi:hypothetical protein
MTESSSTLTTSLTLDDLHGAFARLPADARLWVYGTDRDITDDETLELQKAFDEFSRKWDSHGREVEASLAIVERRFLIIAAHVPGGDVSGCGIDKQVHYVEEAGRRLGLMWSPALSVFYKDASGRIRSVSRTVFRERVGKREIRGTTMVFDPAAAYVADLREGRFARPARESWHRRIFNIPD